MNELKFFIAIDKVDFVRVLILLENIHATKKSYDPIAQQGNKFVFFFCGTLKWEQFRGTLHKKSAMKMLSELLISLATK